jgi:hypothetical protein
MKHQYTPRIFGVNVVWWTSMPHKTHRSNNVSSEESVCLLVSEDFDETVSLADRLCSAVGDEGEFSDVVFHTLKENGTYL